MHRVHTSTSPQLRRTSIVARADHLDRLREIAEADHRTLTQELRRLIENRIVRADAEESKGAAA